MIIARSPLRVTLGGGGTDLRSYYERFEGFLIAAAIDRYVYITLHETFVSDLIVKYQGYELGLEIDQAKIEGANRDLATTLSIITTGIDSGKLSPQIIAINGKTNPTDKVCGGHAFGARGGPGLPVHAQRG